MPKTGYAPKLLRIEGFALKNNAQKPPDRLSPAAKTWWTKLTNEYGIDDQAGLLILETAMRSMDRMAMASALVDQYGAVTVDKFGQLKANPACAVERDSRAAMMAALKSLNLDLEPLGKPGRQPGR
jgi:phage terminase small subunit